MLNNNPAGSVGEIEYVYGAVPADAVTGVTGVMLRPLCSDTVATALVAATGGGLFTIKLKLESHVFAPASRAVTVNAVLANTAPGVPVI